MMLKSETAQLLAIVSAYDNRKVSAEMVEAWHYTIGDLDYEPASRAVVEHFRSSTAWIMPAHIIAIVTPPVEAAVYEVASVPPEHSLLQFQASMLLSVPVEEFATRIDEDGYLEEIQKRVRLEIIGH